MSLISRRASMAQIKTRMPISNHGFLPVVGQRLGGNGVSSVNIFNQYNNYNPPMPMPMTNYGFYGSLFNFMPMFTNPFNFSFGGFGLGGYNPGLFGTNPTYTQQPQQTQTATEVDNELNNIKQVFSDTSKYTVIKQDNKYIVVDGPKQTMYEGSNLNEILDQAGYENKMKTKTTAAKVDNTQQTTTEEVALNDADGAADPAETIKQKDTYRLGHTESTMTKVNIIPFGGAYHYAQLYVDENGAPLKIGSNEFKELVRKLNNGDMLDAGKERALSKEIELSNGKKVKLMDNPNDKIAKGFDTKNDTTAANRKFNEYTETTTQWQLYRNNEQNPILTGTEQECRNKKAELENQSQETT